MAVIFPGMNTEFFVGSGFFLTVVDSPPRELVHNLLFLEVGAEEVVLGLSLEVLDLFLVDEFLILGDCIMGSIVLAICLATPEFELVTVALSEWEV